MCEECVISDLQFKDQLRKDLIYYELLLEWLENGELDKVRNMVEKQIKRIERSLQG